MTSSATSIDRRPRRAPWAVTLTHVVTAGFVPPLVCLIVGAMAIQRLGIEGLNGLVTLLAVLAVGYVAGAVYSMSRLRRTVHTDRPTRCIRPATTAFASLLVLQFALIFLRPGVPRDALSLSIAAPVYLLVIIAFWMITSRGMTAWEAELSSRG